MPPVQPPFLRLRAPGTWLAAAALLLVGCVVFSVVDTVSEGRFPLTAIAPALTAGVMTAVHASNYRRARAQRRERDQPTGHE